MKSLNISELDTTRFGLIVSKIDDTNLLLDKTYRQRLKDAKVKLVISRIDNERIVELNKLEDIGFRLKDMQSTYRYDLVGDNFAGSHASPKQVEIQKAKKSDANSVARLALESFDAYGHYFTDQRLDKESCVAIYADWAKRCCTDKEVADIMFIARIKTEIVGFLSFKLKKLDQKKYGYGLIGCVSSAHRNKKIFSSIVSDSLTWGKEKKLNWMEHNVLTTNYPVNRTFAKLNFRIVKSFSTLHYWIN